MFIEEILAPFKGDTLSDVTEKKDFRTKLLQLLMDIEQRPLRSSEMQLIKSTIKENIVRFNLENDKELVLLLNSRFSYEYIPGVSTLGFSKPVSKTTATNSDESIEADRMQNLSNSSMHNKDNVGKLSRVNSTSGRVVYQLCSVRRQQTALWSSYKMYADGVKEFDDNGALIRTAMNDVPILLYGAKKLKGGAVPQSFVWNITDVKQWKEKSAVGKISKQSSNIYYGSLFPSLNADNVPASPSAQSLSRSSFDSGAGQGAVSTELEDHLNQKEKDKSKVKDSSSDTVDVGLSAGENTAAAPGSKLVSRWSFRVSGTTPSSQLAPSVALSTGSPECAIAVSVHSTGMDKLIHLSGLATMAGSTVGKEAESDGETYTTPLGEQSLIDHLEALNRDELTPKDTEQLGLLQLMSKLPRKIPTAGGKTMHSVAFGRESRVRAASRKNLVVDVVTTSSQAAEAAVNVEWATGTNKLPLLQIGKLEEGVFSLDFYELNPFQAFTIAMAAFDQ